MKETFKNTVAAVGRGLYLVASVVLRELRGVLLSPFTPDPLRAEGQAFLAEMRGYSRGWPIASRGFVGRRLSRAEVARLYSAHFVGRRVARVYVLRPGLRYSGPSRSVRLPPRALSRR